MKTLKEKSIIIVFALILIIITKAGAQEMMVASGAGYKKPVGEIINVFQKNTGITVNAIYGNLQMVAGQAKQSGEVACIIGDRKFLAKLGSTVTFTDYTVLGKGILVLAYRKGVSINSVEEILDSKISSVFMPQDGKAIYGIAGKEALKSLGYYDKVSAKLTQVATVPQVVSYLLTGEADAGFINLTEALANKDKLGGYIIISQDNYTLIEIVAGTVTGFDSKESTVKFIEFLKSNTVSEIASKYGL